MKITIKTLQQKVFYVEAEPDDTISVLKEKILADQGHPVASQKIIFSGKVLSDDKTIQSCEIKEKDFLVLMVSKPKPTPAASTSAAATASTSTSTPPKTAEPAPTAPAPAAAATPETQDSTPSASPAAAAPPAAEPAEAPGLGASFLSGDALQTTIRNMEEMGFPKDQVMRALRASYNNPDRAVEYLFNGIPAHLEAELSAPAAAPARAANVPVNPPASTPAVAPSAAPPQPAAPQNLFQLAQQQQQQQPTGPIGPRLVPPTATDSDPSNADAQLAALRELALQNPALLQPMIQQLTQANPQLGQVLAANPQAILDLLGAAAEVGDDGEPIPPGAQVVNVTPEERAAIERLEALGFPRQAVIEAYFACGKNEELAANFLFEGGFEDDHLS